MVFVVIVVAFHAAIECAINDDRADVPRRKILDAFLVVFSLVAVVVLVFAVYFVFVKPVAFTSFRSVTLILVCVFCIVLCLLCTLHSLVPCSLAFSSYFVKLHVSAEEKTKENWKLEMWHCKNPVVKFDEYEKIVLVLTSIIFRKWQSLVHT